MVKRKATEAVEMELQERTFGNNRVTYCPTKLEKEQVFDCKLTLGSQFHEVCQRILEFLNERELQRMVQDGQEDADVSLPRMCHWVTRKWHKNHAPSHSDVVAAFSSSPCEDACGMLTPTDAELLSTHYISGDFVVSNECAVTRLMSELMSRGLKGAFCEGGPTNVQNMLVYTRGENDDWPTISWDNAAFILVPYCFNGHWVLVRIVPSVKKLMILDSYRSVDSNSKILLDLVTPLARMMPHILVAMGVETETDTQWNIVRPNEFPKQSLRPKQQKQEKKYEVKPQYEELSKQKTCNMLPINAMNA
ncbi:hypothetical protein F511_21182 [Dorcoceras hygrometricum]|uniref:Ubiquitin-like protease family profile domain-containing protein n=1 Tax=Dorcoceras hygrometricum TaxID=472368 RepID=A0A2Z7AC13_9LAMI|nr:hypothetical protein F511_21182 [Dorcoceras hygrometricum]